MFYFLWDEYRQKTRIIPVISDFVYSLMQKIFTECEEALFRRADKILHLSLFNAKCKNIGEFVSGYANDDLLVLYTLHGK